MTPEERAAAVDITVGCGCCFDSSDRTDNVKAIAEAIRAAIAEDRADRDALDATGPR